VVFFFFLYEQLKTSSTEASTSTKIEAFF